MDKKILYAGGAALAAYFFVVSKSAGATPTTSTRTGSLSAPGTGFGNPVTVNLMQGGAGQSGAAAADKTAVSLAPVPTVTPAKNAAAAAVTSWPKPGTAAPAGPTVVDTIKAWFADNVGASDRQIRIAMDANGIGVADVATATGTNFAEVQSRYEAAAYAVPSVDTVKAWFGQNVGATDRQIRAAMDANGVGFAQVAQATGTTLDEVQRRYDAAL